MRLSLIIFTVFLGALFFAPNVHADCVLSNPYWPSGSKRIGETFTISITVSGCGSEGTVQIRVYDDDGLSDDFIRAFAVPTRNGVITQSFVITSNDWEGAGGRTEGPLELYFEAKSCVSSVCTATVTSNQVSLEVESLPDDPTPTPPTGPGGPGGQPISFDFSFPNPLGEDGPDNLLELIEEVARWIMALAIPVAVIFIIYGGLLFLTAGQKPDNVKKGKEILKYAIIGLAIVLIGNGFVSLVRSVIELGGSDTATPTPISDPQSQFPPDDEDDPGLGGLGAFCTSDNQCQSGLVCDSRNECHAPITNKKPSGASCTLDDECLSDRCDSNAGQINVCA